MKKITMIISLLAALLFATTAAAATIPGYSGTTNQDNSEYGATIEFKKKSFEGGQKLAVYTGPGYEYYRDSWANASTDETIWMAGRTGDWAFIMYKKNNGGFRTGYIDASQLQYKLGGRSLNLVSRRATVLTNCSMTDDPKNITTAICTLSAGEAVTFLGEYTDHHHWAYIEAFAEKPVRGFILMDDIQIQ